MSFGFEKTRLNTRKKRRKPEEMPEVKELIKRLLLLEWPKGSDQALPIVVARSLQNYAEWRRAFGEGREVISKRSMGLAHENAVARRQLLLFDHLASYLIAPRYFIQFFMEEVHRSIIGRKRWNGDLRYFTFGPKSEILYRLGRTWTYEYCHRSDLFDELMKEIFNGKISM